MMNGRPPSLPARSGPAPPASRSTPAVGRLLLNGFAIAVALCASAAVAAARQAPAGGVEAVGFGWKYEGYAPVRVVRSKKSGAGVSVKRGTDYVFKYRAQATLKNGGAKAVRAVDWDYVFVEPEGGKELRRYRLQSRQAIEPGATAALSKEVLVQPDEDARHLSAGRQKVFVTRVEYADGSVWRAKD